MRHHRPHLNDDVLVRVLDDELSRWRRRRIRTHLEACSDCRERLRELQLAATYAQECVQSSMADVGDPVALRARLTRSLARAAQRTDQIRTRRRTLLGIGASVLSGIAAIFVLLTGWPRAVAPIAHPVTLSAEPGDLPQPALTPGATRIATTAELCANPRDSSGPIPAAVSQSVIEAYGVEGLAPQEYELDYLITPALGGTADQKNLWPERYTSHTWNAHVKDQLEDLLPELVCQGHLNLRTAQRDIAANWITAYKKYFRTDRPIAPGRSNAPLDGRDAPSSVGTLVTDTPSTVVWRLPVLLAVGITGAPTTLDR